MKPIEIRFYNVYYIVDNEDIGVMLYVYNTQGYNGLINFYKTVFDMVMAGF